MDWATGRLIAKKLADYSLGLFASDEYVAVHGTPETPDQLLDHPLVGYVEDLIYTPELNYAQEFSKDWHSTIEISTAIGQLAAVRAGVGIGILHDFMVGNGDPLVHILPELRATRTYWAAWHENSRGSASVRGVIDGIQSMMKRDRSVLMPSR